MRGCPDVDKNPFSNVQAAFARLRRMRIWGHRFILVGCFTWFAVGATLQLVGGLLQH
jgi:hypothetical protein